MFKWLLGGRKKAGKSVNEVRGRPTRSSPPADPLEARIRARRAQNLRMADIKAALTSAGHVPKPDISGALFDARHAAKGGKIEACRDMVDHALMLKGSKSVIDETMVHPARRYIALAIIRGLLEDKPEPLSEEAASTGVQNASRRPSKP